MPLQLATKLRPTSVALDLAGDVGFREFELWTNEDVLLAAKQVATVCNRPSHRYAVHFPNHAPLRDDAIDGLRLLCDRLWVKAVIMHQPMFDLYGDTVQRENPQVRIGVENGDLDVVSFQRWARENEFLTFDVEHLWKFTLRDAADEIFLTVVDQFLAECADRIVHVHFPGYAIGTDTHRPIYLAGRTGHEVLTLLDRHGYTGFVVSELDSAWQTTTQIRADYDYYHEWLASRVEVHQPVAASA